MEPNVMNNQITENVTRKNSSVSKVLAVLVIILLIGLSFISGIFLMNFIQTRDIPKNIVTEDNIDRTDTNDNVVDDNNVDNQDVEEVTSDEGNGSGIEASDLGLTWYRRDVKVPGTDIVVWNIEMPTEIYQLSLTGINEGNFYYDVEVDQEYFRVKYSYPMGGFGTDPNNSVLEYYQAYMNGETSVYTQYSINGVDVILSESTATQTAKAFIHMHSAKNPSLRNPSFIEVETSSPLPSTTSDALLKRILAGLILE